MRWSRRPPRDLYTRPWIPLESDTPMTLTAPLVDESISPAPPRQLGAGGFLVFVHSLGDDSFGWRDFVGRCGDIPTAKLYALLAMIDDPYDVDELNRIGAGTIRTWEPGTTHAEMLALDIESHDAHIVLGDEIILEWRGGEDSVWAPPVDRR